MSKKSYFTYILILISFLSSSNHILMNDKIFIKRNSHKSEKGTLVRRTNVPRQKRTNLPQPYLNANFHSWLKHP